MLFRWFLDRPHDRIASPLLSPNHAIAFAALGILLLSSTTVEAKRSLRFGVRAGAGASMISVPEENRTLLFEPPLLGEIVLDPGFRPVMFGGFYLLVPIGSRFSTPISSG